MTSSSLQNFTIDHCVPSVHFLTGEKNEFIAGVLKISLAGANNSVPMICLTPCIIIIYVYTCNYSVAVKNIDARWHSLAP